MQRFGVARGTIDRVIRELTEEGIVYSVRGSGTFVSPLVGESTPHAYIILPGNAGSEGGEFWGRLLTEMGGKMNFSVLSAQEMPAAFARISRPGARIAWHCPSLEDFGLIGRLDRMGVPQLLMNRRHPDYSYVSTDTAAGIQSALTTLNERLPKVCLSALMPGLNPGKPFWAERQVMFYTIAQRLKLPVSYVAVAVDDSHDGVVAAARLLLDECGQSNVVFIPEQQYVTTFRALAAERGIRFGTDMFIVMTDYAPSVSDSAGVVSAEQPFAEMQRRAAAWLARRVPERMQILLPPIVHG